MNIKRNIIFSLESRKKDGKPIIENVPIRMRILYAAQRVDFTTGYRIDIAKWDLKKQRVKNNCTNKLQQSASDINSDLDKFSTDIQTIFKEYEIQGILPTPKQLKEAFTNRQNKIVKEQQGDMFIHLFDEFILESGSQNNWATGTIKKFNAVKNHLKSFDENITFQSLDENRLIEYSNHLRDKRDLRNSTIEKQIKCLKWFLRWATKKGYNKNNAFQSYRPKLKTIPKKVIFLSWEELTQLKECKIPKTKQYLERVRDVFLFQCYTGLRYSDVSNLKRSDVKENHIEITTIKTTDSLNIDLNNYSRSILDKYKDEHFMKGRALPVISHQKMNEFLKDLAEMAGIDELIRETYYKGNERIDDITPKYALLSTHAGRRTFICNSLAMGIPAHTVMKWTGHSDYKAMKPYIDVADKDKQKAMTIWDKKEDIETEKLLEQLSKIPKDKLTMLFNGIMAK